MLHEFAVTDKIIEYQDKVEYDIIEVSLLATSNNVDVASKLYEVKGIADERQITNAFLGICSISYSSGRLSEDDILTLLYRLVTSQIYITINKDIEKKIHYLSDGYYLASEGIYGSLKDICSELKEFLDQYAIYAEEFNS